MRRAGVVVALGALLGILGGAVTASPALAGGRGDGWQFVPLEQQFTVDAQFCGFEIHGTHDVDKLYYKELKTADGSLAFLSTGAVKGSLTANGKTITENVSGPAKVIFFPDGSVTVLEKGLQPTALAPDDAKRSNLPGFFISAGALTEQFAPDGTITSLSLNGDILVDVCAALS